MNWSYGQYYDSSFFDYNLSKFSQGGCQGAGLWGDEYSINNFWQAPTPCGYNTNSWMMPPRNNFSAGLGQYYNNMLDRQSCQIASSGNGFNNLFKTVMGIKNAKLMQQQQQEQIDYLKDLKSQQRKKLNKYKKDQKTTAEKTKVSTFDATDSDNIISQTRKFFDNSKDGTTLEYSGLDNMVSAFTEELKDKDSSEQADLLKDVLNLNKDALAKIDIDGNGKFTKGEIEDALKNLGFKESDQYGDNTIERGDVKKPLAKLLDEDKNYDLDVADVKDIRIKNGDTSKDKSYNVKLESVDDGLALLQNIHDSSAVTNSKGEEVHTLSGSNRTRDALNINVDDKDLSDKEYYQKLATELNKPENKKLKQMVAGSWGFKGDITPEQVKAYLKNSKVEKKEGAEACKEGFSNALSGKLEDKEIYKFSDDNEKTEFVNNFYSKIIESGQDSDIFKFFDIGGDGKVGKDEIKFMLAALSGKEKFEDVDSVTLDPAQITKFKNAERHTNHWKYDKYFVVDGKKYNFDYNAWKGNIITDMSITDVSNDD